MKSKIKLKFSIIYGSTRKNRLGIRFVKFLKKQIMEEGHTPYIIDPMKNKFPFLDKRFDDYSKSSLPKSINEVQKLLNKSDAFLIVSAEYNHMPPPALINILNFYYNEYNRKASCICTYSVGDFAGIRVQSPLRAFMTQLGCPPIKYGMFEPRIRENFDNNGNPLDFDNARKRFKLFFDELLWYAKAYKNNSN